MRATVPVTNLVIANGATASNELGIEHVADAESLTIFAPGTLPETVKIQVADNSSPVSADWRDLDQGAGDVTVGAGQAISIDFTAFRKLRLLANGAVAAERVFNVNKIISTR